jgi:hypothetical protein
MAVKVTTKNSANSYVGLEVSGGPGTLRLLLTWPYERAAEVVEIPLDDVESITEVEERHPFGEAPDEIEDRPRPA